MITFICGFAAIFGLIDLFSKDRVVPWWGDIIILAGAAITSIAVSYWLETADD